MSLVRVQNPGYRVITLFGEDMGHYYADLMCDDCGKVRCTCVRSPAKPDLRWIVDEMTMEAITVHDFDKKRPFGMVARLKSKYFKTKKDAEDHSIVLLKEKIKEEKVNLKSLKDQLKNKLKE